MRAKARWRNRITRVATMPWDEIRVRAAQELYKRWDLAVSKVASCKTKISKDIAFAGSGRFFFQATEIPEILECVREALPSVAAKIIEAADEIVQHRFNLLGYEGLDYGREINWHFDAAHGKAAPRVPWHRVPYLDFDQVGDHKVTWELNRHQHLLTLAKAYRLTQNSDYLNELIAQWHHWQDHNPYPIGINWASSLEVAFRSLSWLWTWHLLEGCPVLAGFRLDLMSALMRNGRHIERYLSTYFAPNTHLLGEGVALFFIGTLVPKNPAVQRWQDLGWKIILREAKRQVMADGMHFEQSTYYHVYALDFFLHARILADVNGIAVPQDLDQTIENMLGALCRVGQSGPPPQFGDDDGGRLFDPRRNRIQHMLDPLAIGAVLFRRADWKAAVQSPTEEMIWLLGAKSAAVFDTLPCTKQRTTSAALTESGIYVMSASSPVQQQLVIDAGPQGQGWAGHGHADALSIQLSIGGKPILVDPGTFSYMSSEEDREHFRGTHSHSTIQVDGTSQAQSAGPFKWAKPVHGKAERWISGESFDFFIGSHSGYSRLGSPVIHRRVIFYVKPGFWLIRDVVEGTAAHQIDASWSFAPGSLTVISNRAFFRGSDGALLTAIIAGNDELKYECRQAWYSPCYGERRPAPQLCASAKLQCPTEFATVLFPSTRANVRFEATADGANGGSTAIRAYRLSIGTTVHEMFFSDSLGRWNAGPIASDARLLYCSRASRDCYDNLIACDASYVALKDEPIFSAKSRVAMKEWRGTADTSASTSQPNLDHNVVSGLLEEHA